MAFNTPLTKTEKYTFGRGVLYLALLDALGRPMGERDLGNVPGFTISVTTTRYKHKSSRTGQGITDLDIPTSTELAGKLDVEDMSDENQAIFVAGSVSTLVQEAGAVTNERIYNAENNREYQLGVTADSPTGARGVTAVSIKLYELLNAVARVNSEVVSVGQIFKVSTNVFVVTAVTGDAELASSAPAHATTSIGATTTDGDATVAFIGTTAAYTVDTHYLLSPEAARFGVVDGGALGQACALYTEITGNRLSFNVDYTKEANTRVQIKSSGGGSTACQLRFVADNAEGPNKDLFIAKCNVSASGDNAFITGEEIAKFSLDLGIAARDSATAQIIIDGRVVNA
jgi:hypothetical protein